MIVYHGSNKKFRKFRIAKSLVRSEGTLLNEGLGIYFTTDIEVAKSYGNYLYTVELKEVYDFRNLPTIKALIRTLDRVIKTELNFTLGLYVPLNDIVMYIFYGNTPIHTLDKTIYDYLLNEYNTYKDLGDTKINKTKSLIKKTLKQVLTAYMFNYNIPNIGVIKNLDYATIMDIKELK